MENNNNKKCIWCNNEYTFKNSRQKFCSKICSEAFYLDQREKTDRAKFTIFKRDKFRCVYCGSSPITDDTVSLDLDHVKPICKGGTSNLYNLVTSCSRCNKVKGGIPLDVNIYEEIINRNIELNKGISAEMQKFVFQIIDELTQKTHK